MIFVESTLFSAETLPVSKKYADKMGYVSLGIALDNRLPTSNSSTPPTLSCLDQRAFIRLF